MLLYVKSRDLASMAGVLTPLDWWPGDVIDVLDEGEPGAMVDAQGRRAVISQWDQPFGWDGLIMTRGARQPNLYPLGHALYTEPVVYQIQIVTNQLGFLSKDTVAAYVRNVLDEDLDDDPNDIGKKLRLAKRHSNVSWASLPLVVRQSLRSGGRYLGVTVNQFLAYINSRTEAT